MIVLVGVPGSGKSTWAKAQNCQVLSSDDFRHMLCGDETNQNIHQQVFAAMRHILRARLETAQATTIIDATNLRVRGRRPWIQMARKFGARVEAMYFDVPPAVALERNELRERRVPPEVIHKMYETMQLPTVGEGFDEVMTVGGSQNSIAV